jgi:steroid delta-isomerase-like uncharacterized protein
MGLIEADIVSVVVPSSRRDFFRAGLAASLLGIGPAGQRGSGAAGQSAPPPFGPSASLRELFARYLHCLNGQDAPSLSQLFDEWAEYRDLSFGVRLVGRDAIRNMFARTFAAFGAAPFVIKSRAFDHATIAVRWEVTGRHRGPLLGVPASGRELTLRGATFLSIESGKVREQVDFLDRAGLERQLGVRGAPRE